MRIAALDIGTNTALLVVVESNGPPTFKVVMDRHAIARLGEAVDQTGVINEAAYQRFRLVLREHVQAIETLNVDRVIAIATSAMRDAMNREEIIGRVQQEFGIKVELISGSTESELTYRGALAGLALPMGCEKIGVVDIGGGSTEISFGTQHQFISGHSFDIGAVRMTERYFVMRPVSFDARDLANSSIRSILRSKDLTKNRIDELVAVAGTPTTLASMALGLTTFDASRIQGYRLSIGSVTRLINEIQTMTMEDLIVKYPAINKGRADILLAGSLILGEVMRLLRVDSVLVSTRGLRYGVVIQELERVWKAPNTDWQIIET
jgi:exopolyphosphatase/guanosine-5'-triphosphate,3'-diphosphate pyrophosphatase